MQRFCQLLVLILSTFIATQAMANTPIRVGVVNEAPFAFHKNGQYHGFSYALWDEIANRLNIKYTVVNASTDLLVAENALAHHQYDVLIGPIRVITSNINTLTFSRPYFLDHISLATRETPSSFWKTLLSLVQQHGSGIISFYLGLLIIFSALIWVTEFRSKTSKHVFNQWFYSLWFAFIVLFSLSFISTPTKRLSRIITAFWLVISLSFIALFSALVTSSLTVSHLNDNTFFTDAKMLNHKTITAVEGSAANFTARYFGASVVDVTHIQAGLNLVKANKVYGFLGSAVGIKDALQNKRYASLTIHPQAYHVSEIAFAFPTSQSKLKNEVNRVLVNLQDTHKVLPICNQYLNKKDSLACLI